MVGILTIIILVLVVVCPAVFILSNRTVKNINKIQYLIDDNQIQEAERLLAKVRSTKNTQYELTWLQAQINMKLARYSLVLTALDNLLQELEDRYNLVPEKKIRKMLAQVYIETSQLTSAEKELKTILLIDENDLQSNYNLGKLYFQKHKYLKAQHYLLRSLNYSKESHIAFYMIAFIYDKGNDLKKAKKYVSASLKVNKEYQPSLFLAAKTLYNSKKFEEARDIFQKFETDSEFFSNSQTLTALSYYEEGDKEKFMESAREILYQISDYTTYNEVAEKLMVSYIDTKKIVELLSLMTEIENISWLKFSILRKIKAYRFVRQYETLRDLILANKDEFARIMAEIIEKNHYNIDEKNVTENQIIFQVRKGNNSSMIIINRSDTILTLKDVKGIIEYAKSKSQYYVGVYTPFVFDDEIGSFTNSTPALEFYNGKKLGEILENEARLT